MPNSTKITDHVDQALDRLLTQYKETVTWTSFLTAITDQVQDLEDTIFDLDAGRNINTAIGQQLDNLGELVGQSRLGFNDDFYRILLFVRIGLNTSQGDPVKVIAIFKLLSQSAVVHYQNLQHGHVMLGTSSQFAADIVQFAYDNMELVVAGGIRIDHIVFFAEDEPFSFSGSNTAVNSFGFSDITSLTGGKFAGLHRDLTPMAFSGNDNGPHGFGSLVDPRAGGTLVGI